MTELKLQQLPDRTAVKISITLSPELHRALGDYAQAYRETYGASEPVHELIPAMLEAFIHSDRVFAQRRRKGEAS